MPFFSIIIPSYNRAEYLPLTINSVQNQIFQDWECIVVDDGSKVTVKPIVDEFNDERFVLLTFPENRGIPNGANAAYQLASGEFIQTLG